MTKEEIEKEIEKAIAEINAERDDNVLDEIEREINEFAKYMIRLMDYYANGLTEKLIALLEAENDD